MKKLLKIFKPEYFILLFFIAIHLPYLGHDNFNTDVWKWKARSYNFGNALATLNLQDTAQTYHPGVTVMWIGFTAVKIYNFYADNILHAANLLNSTDGIFQLDFIEKYLTVISIGLVLMSCFYVLKQLFGVRKAFIMIFVLSFEPFYLALTRVFHLEGLMTTLMLASYLWLFYYLHEPKKIKFVLSAVFAGLAVLTKTSAVFMIPFAGLVFLINEALETKNFKCTLVNTAKKFFSWFGLFIVAFVIIWPAMWVSPAAAISKLYAGINDVGIEGDHVQYYFGKSVADPGWTYYFVVIALRSSILLLVGLAGALLFFKQVFSNKIEKRFFLYSLCFVLFYMVQLTLPTKKLDRYGIPVILILSLLSSYFWIWAGSVIKWKSFLKYIPVLVVAVIPFYYLNFDYFTYYNPMFGGLSKGIYILEPKWMIGERAVTTYFNDMYYFNPRFVRFYANVSIQDVITNPYTKNKVLTVGFPEKYYTQIYPFFREIGAYATIKEIGSDNTKTKYYVYPAWSEDLWMLDKGNLHIRKVDTIYVRGVPMYFVFKTGSAR